jgi:hypothetical protein
MLLSNILAKFFYPTEAGFALAMKEMQGKTGPLRFSEMTDVSHLDELSRWGFSSKLKRIADGVFIVASSGL